MTEGALVPVAVRVELAHAAVQRLAEQSGVDLLHIKGPAVHPGLRRTPSSGSDVDVVVRPDGVDALMAALAAHGWRVETEFTSGSAFDHAANLYHPSWGLLDVHRHYPGMDRDPAHAFDVLWGTRGSVQLAHVSCAVPDPLSQSLVLLLHAARTPHEGAEHPDVGPNWHERTPQERDRIREIAVVTGATVGLAAATGHLAEHAHDPEAALWRVFTEGGDRLDEWGARFRSARGPRAKASVAVRSLGVNRYYLAQKLGHQPSRPEVAAEFFRRLAAAASGVVGRLRRGARR
jgi:hypothetical protein